MKRRDFLQRSSLTLATLGLSDLTLAPIAQRYQQVLAAPTQRKLALLIGINHYRSVPLYGCVTDVELQRELLIHRFGFQPSDILTLTDQKATREAIATGFVEHLIEQARSGDVVVFHFSGYGGKVVLHTASDTAQANLVTQPSLVTVDEPSMQGDGLVVNDLLADTLLLLLRSLLTDRVTTILDTSYTHPDRLLQGNLRLRSRPDGVPAQPSEAELALQASLLSQTNLDRARLAVQRRSGQMPGVVLAAAGMDQWAAEARWHGFSAGLFTYALTQQLWQATPATALRISVRRATEQVQQVVQAQQPQLSGQNSHERPLTPYHVPPLPAWGVAGVVVSLEDDRTAQLWLGGLPAAVLEQYETHSLVVVALEVVVASEAGRDRTATQLQILSREGLLAKAKRYPDDEIASPLQVGQFVREQVRVLPRTVGLTIALDSQLARIERVDAVSTLATVPRVAAAIAGEQAADYLFSKIQKGQPTQVAALPPSLPDGSTNKAVSQNSYALFSPGRSAVPNTAGQGGEAVKAAVKRLIPKLQTLLAAKLLNLTVNDDSSQLAVRATLTVLTPQARALMQRETSTIVQRTPIAQTLPSMLAPETATLVSLPIGRQIQYQLENQSTIPLHFLLLHLDSSGDLILLRSPLIHTAPLTTQPATDGQTVSDRPFSTIAPGETLTLPQASASFQWLTAGPTGRATTYLLCSRAPFSQTMALLGARSPDAPPLQALSKPLEVAQAILQDLHDASDRVALPSGNLTDSFVLDMNAWASLRFVYESV